MAQNPPRDYPGLTSAQVAERINRGETNDFKVQVGRTYWQIVRDNLFNLFNVVLAILGVIMILFQDYANLIFASFSVVLNSLVGLIQEIAAKRALEKLAAMSIQQVKVWRDGRLILVPVNELVKDDVIAIEPGDRIAVDGKVVAADALEMDEALLTGESDAVYKELDDTLFSGSFVVGGAGVFVATHVGVESTVTKLSMTAKQYRHPLTPTQKQINRLVQIAVLVMLIFGPMTVLAGIVSRLPTIEIVRNAVVLVTSMVPQGLVLVTTISLSIGALIISRSRTLVQRVNAVESMANVNVLCFDKTGTLTRNQLSVSAIIPLNGADEGQIKGLLAVYTHNLAHMNKTAGAIAAFVGDSPDGVVKQAEIPFTSGRKWGAVVFPEQTLILGAPERVLDAVENLDTIEHADSLSSQGQRVLALARATEAPASDKLNISREPLALIVMSDKVRAEIETTIRQFADLGVDLKVISGDNLETVRAIAHEAGMTHARAFTGEQIETMGENELDVAVREANVFARVEPETKRKLIRAMKAQGKYVAMVGDGVNDVPALKEANMAVAMNDGAQIAKDVADLVLLDNSMATLPFAFDKGKIITQKIFGTTKLFLSKNFYTVLAFIFVGFMALPFPTTPILISWLTFGVVNIPGGLITFGLMRPAYSRDFIQDVIRYVAAVTIVGGLITAGLYTGFYLMRFDQDFNAALPQISPEAWARYERGEAAEDPLLFKQDEGARALAEAQASTSARNSARSALYVFMTFYGLGVFWHTMGLQMFEPKTLLARPRMAALGGVLFLATLLPPYFLPNVFQGWVAPSFGLWVVSFGGAVLASYIVYRVHRDNLLANVLEANNVG